MKLTLKKINSLYKAIIDGKDKPTHYYDNNGLHKI